MSTLALRGFRCHACRQNALQSFVTLAGVSIAPARQARRVIASGQPWKNSSLLDARAFSSPSFENKTAPNQPDADNDSTMRKDGSQAAEHVPWYLRDAEAAEASPHSVRERQQLPPLPSDPPPILGDLLQHLSVDIGLDDISLIDLRGAHPPPALGMDVVMIIGTARSVKHLNVSADRLCRWLRKTHKLTPVADGLIGRNELKIKLKRKARRAKLGKNIGRDIDGRDDGLTTSWICVNVGQVEDGRPSKAKRSSNTGFVGFGPASDRAQIVVQMFTEEMREEFDLESLWNERSDRKFEELNDIGDNDFLDDVHLPHGESLQGPSNQSSISTPNRLAVIPYVQRRGICTTRSMLATGQAQGQAGAGSSAGTLNREMRLPPEPTDSKINIPSLFQHLSGLSMDEAQHELGQGPHDKDSTLFLQMFERGLTEIGPSIAALHRFKLIAAAVALSHPGYTKTHLFEAFKDLASSGFDISQADVFGAVRALLSFPRFNSDERPSALPPVPEKEFELALRVLDHASLRGVDVLHEHVFFSLFSAAGYQGRVRPDNEPDPSATNPATAVPAETLRFIQETQNRLIKSMRLADVWFDSDTFLKVLRILYHHGNYDTFWTLWRRKVMRGAPRTEEEYLMLFQLHAERQHQSDTSKCLAYWVPMMERESPPVYVDSEMARTLMDCLIIADPMVEQKARNRSPGVFVDYWIQCGEILKAGAQQ